MAETWKIFGTNVTQVRTTSLEHNLRRGSLPLNPIWWRGAKRLSLLMERDAIPSSRGYDVRATDYSQVAQKKAKALAKEAGVDVDFVLSDIYDTGWSDQAYDNVVAIFIQFVPPERMDEIFTALARGTGAGGTLLIHGYTPEQVALGTGGPGNPDHMYTPDMLANAFSHMQITVNRAYTATLDEGRGHSGPSALIDFVAKG